MGSAIQAGDSAISRCRNRELNTAEPDTAGKAQESWPGSDPGMARGVCVPAPPASSVTVATGHENRKGARERAREVMLDPGDLMDTPVRNRAKREPAQTGTQAIPARCRRVIVVQLATAINGQLRSLQASQVAWSARLSRMICPIPKLRVRVRFPSPAPR